MKTDLPGKLEDLSQLFQAAWGFSLIDDFRSGSFNNRILVFSAPPYTVRILCERGIWFIELSEKEASDQWYDTALIREAVDGQAQKDEMSLDEKISFWETRWQDIQQLFQSGAKTAHIDLEHRRIDRGKRRFPFSS